MDLELASELAIPGATGKIILLVADGLGGLPHPATGRSELETARTPNLDAVAREGMCGLTIPVAPGVTPGSGPGHLALFGYDPVRYNIGRGVLEAVGIDFDLGPTDVAARGNFCTVDGSGAITDRRAARIPTAASTKLVERLRTIELPGVEVILEPVRDHRFVLVLRGEGLSDALTETDPQKLGVPPLPVRAASADAAATATAKLLNDWIAQAAALLKDEHPANMLLLRGFAKYPALPQFAESWGLRAAAIAVYPMYRGLGQARRHGGARQRPHLRRRGRGAAGALRSLRLLLHPLQEDGRGRRGRRLRRQGRGPRGARRDRSRRSSPSTPTCS